MHRRAKPRLVGLVGVSLAKLRELRRDGSREDGDGGDALGSVHGSHLARQQLRPGMEHRLVFDGEVKNGGKEL